MIPIDSSDQDELIELLKGLVVKHGSEDFLHAPIILPTDAFFPDTWRADRPGIEPMIARLLARVRLGHLKFTLSRVPKLEEASAFLIRWIGRDDQGRLKFELNPTVAHSREVCAEAVQREITRVWLCEKRGHDLLLPFDGVGEEHESDDDFEVLIDVACVYLGFGALSVNLGVPSRYDAIGAARMLSSVKAIESVEVTFLLAVMLRARSRIGELEAVLPELTSEPRGALQSMQAQLMPGETYRRWLEIAVIGDPPTPPVLPEPVKTLREETFEAEEYTLRKRERRWSMLFLGLAAGIPVSMAAWYLGWIPVALGAALAWNWTYATCWRCGFFMKPSETSCFNCHALIVGTIDGAERAIDPRFTDEVKRLDDRRREREQQEELNQAQLEKEAVGE